MPEVFFLPIHLPYTKGFIMHGKLIFLTSVHNANIRANITKRHKIIPDMSRIIPTRDYDGRKGARIKCLRDIMHNGFQVRMMRLGVFWQNSARNEGIELLGIAAVCQSSHSLCAIMTFGVRNGEFGTFIYEDMQEDDDGLYWSDYALWEKVSPFGIVHPDESDFQMRGDLHQLETVMRPMYDNMYDRAFASGMINRKVTR